MTGDGFSNLNSLDLAGAKEILRNHGVDKLIRVLIAYFGGNIFAVLALLQGASSLYTDYTARTSAAKKQEAFDTISRELPKLVDAVRRMNVPLIDGGFNSDLRYVNAFASTAFIGIALAIKVGKDAVSRIGTALDAIKEELSIQTIAKVQGWSKGGLGDYIYRLVRGEIERCRDDNDLHFFYVWTPGNTSWHTGFADRFRERPLGRQFGGYHHDLGTICNLMWSNRMTLIATEPHGEDAIFHLMVPSFETIAIDDPIIFHQSLHPLVVKGDLYRGHPLVWLNPALPRDRRTFQNIGILPDINEKVMDAGFKAFLGCWVSGAACAAVLVAGATICPPLLAYEPYLATTFASSVCAGMSSGIGTIGTLAYNDLTKPRPRLLGHPLFIGPTT